MKGDLKNIKVKQKIEKKIKLLKVDNYDKEKIETLNKKLKMKMN